MAALSACDGQDMGGCGEGVRECTGVKELCVALVLIWGNLSALGVGLYSYLCHHHDFTPDIFTISVNKYIKIGIKECVFLDRWWWGSLA